MYSVKVQRARPRMNATGKTHQAPPAVTSRTACTRKKRATGTQITSTATGLMWVKNSRKSDLNSRIGTSLWLISTPRAVVDMNTSVKRPEMKKNGPKPFL